MRIHGLTRTSLAALAVVIGGLLFGASAVFAAGPPEKPVTEAATGVTATTATLNGELNPGGAGEAGGYRFSYKPTETRECEPEGILRPEVPASAKGAAKEKVSVNLTGLEPNREYAFCVLASNLLAEVTPGLPAETFKTSPEAPTIASESASVTSTGATLQAEINPNNQVTEYVFEYSTQGKVGAGEALEGTVEQLLPAEPLPAIFGAQPVSLSTAPVLLTPGTTYYYRVTTKNEKSETSQGKVEAFATVPTPHTDPVTAIGATTATFNGHLTLDSVDTKYSFDYNTGTACAGQSTTPQDAGKGSTSKALSTNVTGLQPNQEYAVCLVDSNEVSGSSGNALGSEVDPTVATFTTLTAPPTIKELKTANVTPFALTVEATVNPDNEASTCEVEYGTTPAANEAKAPCEQATLEGAGQPASANLTNLRSNTKYFYRLLLKNTTGKAEAEGNVTTLTAEKPTIELGSEKASTIEAREASVEALVNPNYQATSYSFEYSTKATGEVLEGAIGTVNSTIPLPAGTGAMRAGPDSLGNALQPDTAYYYRVLATNATGTTRGPVETFTTLVAPTATTGTATEITRTTAVIGGEIGAEGVETHYYVQYGLGASYSYSAPASPGFDAGAEATPVVLGTPGIQAVALGELTPGTTYNYRLVAVGSEGTITYGAPRSFTTAAGTLPLALTGGALGVSQRTATITGSVDTAGLQSTMAFEFGTTPALGSLEPGQVSASTGTTYTIEASFGTSLQPGTTYYYRTVATNADGASYGTIQSFTTAPFPETTAIATTPLLSLPTSQPPPAPVATPATTKTPTRAQKLKKALKACSRDKNEFKRDVCERNAHKRYGKTNSKKKGKRG